MNLILIHKCKFGGLGDFIRASISLFCFSKYLNFQYFIDFSDNPDFHKCFDYHKINIDNSNFETIIITDYVNFNKMKYNIKKLKKKYYNILSNSFGFVSINTINQYIDEYNSTILKPSILVINNINSILNHYNLINNHYVSIHVRCGDYTINNVNNSHNDFRLDIHDMSNYHKLHNIITSYFNNSNIPIIIHSDSIVFKQNMKSLYPQYIFLDIDIIHTSLNKNCSYLSTISEFYLISSAHSICMPITYSGFSHWASVIGKKNLITSINNFHFTSLL